MQKRTKILLIVIGIGVLSPIIVVLAPFLLGGYASCRIFKSKNPNSKAKALALAIIAMLTLLVGLTWTPAFFKQSETTTEKTVSGTGGTAKQATEGGAIQETTPSVSELVSPVEKKKEQLYKVARVVDGDTIELEDGTKVRYIGTDTPETVNLNTAIECFGHEASNINKELVEGKEVSLEKDVSETDRYDRLLRYVYVGDVFVNDFLVRQGYANASSYPPDIKYQDQFTQAEAEARENNRGLWSSCNKPVETQQRSPVPAIVVPTAPDKSTSYTCNCKKTCAQMSSCEEAQYQLNVCSCKARDGDHDGIACDTQCQ